MRSLEEYNESAEPYDGECGGYECRESLIRVIEEYDGEYWGVGD